MSDIGARAQQELVPGRRLTLISLAFHERSAATIPAISANRVRSSSRVCAFSFARRGQQDADGRVREAELVADFFVGASTFSLARSGRSESRDTADSSGNRRGARASSVGSELRDIFARVGTVRARIGLR